MERRTVCDAEEARPDRSCSKSRRLTGYDAETASFSRSEFASLDRGLQGGAAGVFRSAVGSTVPALSASELAPFDRELRENGSVVGQIVSRRFRCGLRIRGKSYCR